ncbi:Ionotropic receptor 423 [Blattella germanica]|nr:Ionotropic receptor 423 [Blattella germanica]
MCVGLITKVVPLVCCFFVIGGDTFLFTDSEISLEQDFAECILSISQTYLDSSLPLAVQTPGSWDSHFKFKNLYGDIFLKTLSDRGNKSQYILGYTGNFKTRLKFDSFIILLPPLKPVIFSELLGSMIMRISMDLGREKTKGIIIIMEHFDSEEFITIFLQSLFSFALKFTVVQIIAVVPQANPVMTSARRIDVFSWLASVQTNICSRKVDNVRYIDTWNSEENSFIYGSNLFPSPSVSDMRGCRVNLFQHTNYPLIYNDEQGLRGVGFQFLSMFCKRFNCLIINNWDKSRNDDVRFPVIYGRDEIYLGYLTYPYFRVHYSWFVPAGSARPRWQSIVRVFTPLMWTFSVVACILGSCTFWLIQKCRMISVDGDRSIKHSGLITLLTHLVLSNTINCRDPLAVTFFTAWLLYCMIINTAYQAGLFELIVYPGQFPAIKNLEELEKSGLHKKSGIQMHNADEYWQKFNEYENCTKLYMSLCLEDVEKYGNFAYLYDQEYGKMFASLHKDERGKDRVLSLKEVFAIGYQGFYISNFFHILGTTPDALLHRTVSAGLIDKWARDELHVFHMQYPRTEAETVFPLSLIHLQSPFYLLVVGLMMSLLVCLIEMSMHNLHTVAGS